MAITERKQIRFTVKEYGDGTPWIMLEQSDGSLKCIGDGFLGLDLKAQHTYEKAREIARYLNEHVAAVAHTAFEAKDRQHRE
jgi:hypothetical protein